MTRTAWMLVGCFGLTWLGVQVLAAATPPREGEETQVVLRATASAAESSVRLADIADIRGDAAVCQRLAELDVADLQRPGQSVTISRDYVSLRLQVAGFDAASVSVSGTKQCLVTLERQQVTSKSLLAAAERAVRKRLPANAEEVSIRLAQPVTVPTVESNASDQIRLSADLRTPAPVGRVRAEVSIYVNGQRRTFVPLFLDVTYAQEAAIVRRRVQPGEVLKESDLASERYLVDGNETPLNVAECVGKHARVALKIGQRIGEGDLEAGPVEEPLLVKNRELVRLVAKVGPLRLTAVGEALQDGRAGEVIRVRNVDSNKIVSGRVLERAVVEVDF
jgi:flagellar basal body P-ring formation protein FlgA